ncbi:hypothetical protein TYRP_018125 [Tyrophagus putrescentiae]|nr:hypothetical protein TYRP_018125 [Tyrophagus putrescentiae]
MKKLGSSCRKKKEFRRFDEKNRPQQCSDALQMVDALEYCHQNDQSSTPRDIKPENTLIGYHHELKISDFGSVVGRCTHALLQAQDKKGCAAPPHRRLPAKC